MAAPEKRAQLTTAMNSTTASMCVSGSRQRIQVGANIAIDSKGNLYTCSGPAPRHSELSVCETRQRRERGDQARALARRERLAQEKKTEQRRDDEPHLRNGNHHARFPARQAFNHKGEGKGSAIAALGA